MLSFIRTPTGFWTVLGVVTALLAIFATVYFGLHPISPERKRLDVAMMQNVVLEAKRDLTTKGSLEFLYNGQKVSNLLSTKIRLFNSGNQPIEKNDIIRGFDIKFPQDTRIIDYRLSEIQPDKSSSLYQQGFVEIKSPQVLNLIPELINPGDIFDVDILTTRDLTQNQTSLTYSPDEITFDYRIVGVSRISSVAKIPTNDDKRTEARDSLWKMFTSLFLPAIIGIGFLGVFFLLTRIRLVLFPKKERIETEQDKARKILQMNIFAYLLFGSILLLIVYLITRDFYVAFFL